MSTLLKNCQHTLNQPKNKTTFKQNIPRQFIVFSKMNLKKIPPFHNSTSPKSSLQFIIHFYHQNKELINKL